MLPGSLLPTFLRREPGNEARPSHYPVFDCFHYEKMEVRARPDIIYHMSDANIYLGRRRGGGFQLKDDMCSTHKFFLLISNERQRERLGPQHLNQHCNIQESSFHQGSLPNVTHVINGTRPSYQFLHTGSIQNLDSGKTSEQGKRYSRLDGSHTRIRHCSGVRTSPALHTV